MGENSPLFTFKEIMLTANLCEHTYSFAMPAYDGKICMETSLSILDSCAQLAKGGVGFSFNFIRSGALIDATRNELIYRFLNETKADTLICIDADIVFSFEMLKRLLIYSHHYPIVTGAYTGKADVPKFIVTVADNKLNKDGLLPVNSLGFGFVAIQRKALEQMAPLLDSYYMKDFGTDIKAYFRLLIENGQYVGEDIYFFNKAVEAGIQPMLDPMIELGHMGIKQYNTPFKAVLPQLLKEV
jgi:hypothetical protein